MRNRKLTWCGLTASATKPTGEMTPPVVDYAGSVATMPVEVTSASFLAKHAGVSSGAACV